VEVLELLTRGADEHVAHEEGMVSTRADDADLDTVLLVPAGIAVDDVDAIAGVEVVDGALAVDLPDLLGVSGGSLLLLELQINEIKSIFIVAFVPVTAIAVVITMVIW